MSGAGIVPLDIVLTNVASIVHKSLVSSHLCAVAWQVTMDERGIRLVSE